MKMHKLPRSNHNQHQIHLSKDTHPKVTLEILSLICIFQCSFHNRHVGFTKIIMLIIHCTNCSFLRYFDTNNKTWKEKKGYKEMFAMLGEITGTFA